MRKRDALKTTIESDDPKRATKIPEKNVHSPPTVENPFKTDLSRYSSTIRQSAAVFKGIMRMVATSEARVIRGDVDARESGFTSIMSDIVNDL